MRRAFLILTILALAVTPHEARADEHGARAFAGIDELDVDLLTVRIALFDDATSARAYFAHATSEVEVAAIDDQYRVAADHPDDVRARLYRPPAVGDETFYHQTFLGSGYRADRLIIRRANVVYVLDGVELGDPLPTMLTVYRNIERRSSADVRDLLPDQDDLPYPMTQIEIDVGSEPAAPCDQLGAAIAGTYFNIINGEVQQAFKINGQRYFPEQVAAMSEGDRYQLAQSWMEGISRTLGVDARQRMHEYEANKDACVTD